MTFLRMFAKRKPKVPKLYAEQKDALTSAKKSERLSLAQNTKTNQEILYYLAEHDPDPQVRKAVVNNESTPVQVTPVLAQDPDKDVRLALVKRLIKLLPELSEEEHSQIYSFAVQALGTLALDEVLKIRVALSSTLKDHLHTPPKVAGQLARDVEREVSEPILRFCAALEDSDLLDILKNHPESWAVQAVAQREKISSSISEAVIDTEDVPGGTFLIENKGADITEELLVHILEKAKDLPEWQGPLAGRPKLPNSLIRELAEFVDASVRDILIRREDFDEEIAEEISEIFRRRIDYASDGTEDDGGEAIKERLDRVQKEGRLNEETISDALAMRDTAFVSAAIARMLKVEVNDVVKVFEMQAPKAIVAIAWRANLSMRMALRLQQEIGHIPHKELIYPRDGSEYPLSKEDIKFQLEFLGFK